MPSSGVRYSLVCRLLKSLIKRKKRTGKNTSSGRQSRRARAKRRGRECCSWVLSCGKAERTNSRSVSTWLDVSCPRVLNRFVYIFNNKHHSIWIVTIVHRHFQWIIIQRFYTINKMATDLAQVLSLKDFNGTTSTTIASALGLSLRHKWKVWNRTFQEQWTIIMKYKGDS